MNYHHSFDTKKTTANMKILSSGMYLPENIVSSEDIFEEFHSETNYGIAKNWMSKTMGIKERRVSSSTELPSDLAVKAARNCVDKAGLDKEEIDMVLYCGIERDQVEPATAHTVQRRLGLSARLAFDVTNACFGFIDGLRIADQFIYSGTIRYALICTGETSSRMTSNVIGRLKEGIESGKALKMLGFLSLGDAGGAVIVGPSNDDSGFKAFETQSNSYHHKKCYYKYNDDGSLDAQMMMAQIVAKTYRMQENLISPTLDKIGWDHADFLLTHQVGKKSFDQVADAGVVDRDKMIKSFDKLGNITSATFPVNHYQLTQRKDVQRGDRIYCCYSGSGIVIGQFGYSY